MSFQPLGDGGIALFLPLIRHDAHLSFTDAGVIAASSTFTYAVMQIPAGYLADRWSPRLIFLVGLLGANLLVLSFSQLRVFPAMVVNQAISGFFRAFTFAPGMVLMLSVFPPHRRATAMGVFVAGGLTSTLLLNIFGPPLVGPLGWRGVFIVFAVLALATVAACWRWGPRSSPPSATSGPVLAELRAIARSPGMWLVASIQYVRLAVNSGLNFWLPTLIVIDKHYPLAVAGGLVALNATLSAPSRLIGGYVSDRLHNPLLVIGSALVILTGTTFLLGRVESLPLLVAVVAVNGFFVQCYFGPLFALPVDLLGLRSAGLTGGFSNFFANLGGLTMAYLLGVLRDSTGSFRGGLDAMSVLCLVGLALVLALSRLAPRRSLDSDYL